MKKLLIFGITILLIVTGCKKSDEQVIRKSSDNIGSKGVLINNNRSSLNERLSLAGNTPAYIFGDTAKKTMKSTKGTVSSSVTIQLIARLSPPEYNGEVLQASHVRIVDHYAYNIQHPRSKIFGWS